jgi:hypothetical protein
MPVVGRAHRPALPPGNPIRHDRTVDQVPVADRDPDHRLDVEDLGDVVVRASDGRFGSYLAVPHTSGGGLLSGLKQNKHDQELTLGSKVGLLQESGRPPWRPRTAECSHEPTSEKCEPRTPDITPLRTNGLCGRWQKPIKPPTA